MVNKLNLIRHIIINHWKVTYIVCAIILLSIVIVLPSILQPNIIIPTHLKTQDNINIVDAIQPILASSDLDTRKVALGRQLFHDTILSGDNTIACSSCHNLADGGMDGRVYAIGINGSVGEINTPTVYNSGLNFVSFWDGRELSLEDQVSHPIHDPREMGSSWEEVLSKLQSMPTYVNGFSDIYKDGINIENIEEVLATFERSLVTVNSRFDQYLNGEADALTEEELQGYQHFIDFGCVSCHQGANVGGNMYQRMGIINDYFADQPEISQVDYGRFNITQDEKDRHVFKVPSLRTVAFTAPYFHDGSAETLEDAIIVMGYYQLGRNISYQDANEIASFLHTLAGEHPELTLDQ